MGIISLEKADHLFWLGRYTERVFTTLDTFFLYFDKMLDQDSRAYMLFCDQLSIPMVYADMDEFIDHYLFDELDPNSIKSNMLRAFDNAVVLRDELSSSTLSYIQMSLDCMEQAVKENGLVYQLQPVKDYLYAFWGCLDDHVEDEECRNIIKCGKYLERLDLYIRLGYPYRFIEKEHSKFINRLQKIQIGYNLSRVDDLAEILSTDEKLKAKRQEALLALWNIF